MEKEVPRLSERISKVEGIPQPAPTREAGAPPIKRGNSLGECVTL
jgi:hypothetical protein